MTPKSTVDIVLALANTLQCFEGAGAHCLTTEFLEHRQDIPQPINALPEFPLPPVVDGDIRCPDMRTGGSYIGPTLRLPCFDTVTTYVRDKALEGAIFNHFYR